MAHNLTDVDTFTAAVTVPDGGDPRTAASVEVGFQALANRTRNLKNGLDPLHQFARFAIVGADVPALTPYPLTEAYDPSNSYSVAANAVTVPAPGFYLCCLSMLLGSSDTTDPLRLAADLYGPVVGGTLLALRVTRYSATPSDSVSVAGSQIVQVADVAHTIRVQNIGGSPPLTNALNGSVLTILRLS